MKLEVSNFAKIRHANLNVDGITVIAGENNTGKTTIGKILYCFFNSLFDIGAQVEVSKEYEINDFCNRYFRNSIVLNTKLSDARVDNINLSSRMSAETVCREIASLIINCDPDKFNEDMYANIIYDCYIRNDKQISHSEIKRLVEYSYEKVEKIVKSDNRVVALEMIYSFFDVVFSSQILPLSSEDSTSKVKVTLKDKPISIAFHSNDEFEVENNGISIMHEAYFLDDPFVLDSLGTVRLSIGRNRFRNPRPRDFLISKLRTASETGIENPYESGPAREKLQRILGIIDDVVQGQITSKQGKWMLSERNTQNPVDFYNISAGLKSFVVLKMLLEKGILKEKDVLILDEPEIHLHPEWQIKYAEVIVLLQKEFNLSVVVTTHSRDFLEAIELFSQKHNIHERCSFYLSKIENGYTVFEDVSNDSAKIYHHLVKPSTILDRIRFELEDGEYE